MGGEGGKQHSTQHNQETQKKTFHVGSYIKLTPEPNRTKSISLGLWAEDGEICIFSSINSRQPPNSLPAFLCVLKSLPFSHLLSPPPLVSSVSAHLLLFRVGSPLKTANLIWILTIWITDMNWEVGKRTKP